MLSLQFKLDCGCKNSRLSKKALFVEAPIKNTWIRDPPPLMLRGRPEAELSLTKRTKSSRKLRVEPAKLKLSKTLLLPRFTNYVSTGIVIRFC